MSETTTDVRRDIAASRERISETVIEIEARVSSKVDGAKRRLDVGQLVRDHPWPAIAVALGAGLAFGASGADRRAADATVTAAKKASRASAAAAKSAVRKVRGSRDTEALAESDDWSSRTEQPRGAQRLGGRLVGLLASPVAAAFERLLDEMRVASRSLGSSMSDRSGQWRDVATHGVPSDMIVAEESETVVAESAAASEVPVPPEMLPSELDARADAIEALGQATKEPPLAPGAGDLGARWA